MLTLNKDNIPTLESTIKLLSRLVQLETDEDIQKELAFTLLEIERLLTDLRSTKPNETLVSLNLKDLPKKRPNVILYDRERYSD